MRQTLSLMLACVAACAACGGAEETPVSSSAVADAGADARIDGGDPGGEGGVGRGEGDGSGAVPGANTSMVYVGERGVSTPWITPISGAAVGTPVQLGPRRGAGYGMGQGAVSYPDLTPDGAHLVVAFYPLHTPAASYGKPAHLFALPIDGGGVKAPIKIAVAPELHATARAYTAGMIAYVDGRRLFVAHLDGSDVAQPTLVAQVEQGWEIGSPRWLPGGDELAWAVRNTSGGAPTVYVGAADGTEFAKPRKQMTGKGPAEHVAAVLADGRLVVRGSDDRLYAVSTTAAKAPVALTPAGFLTSTVGPSADGKRLAVVLRTTWQKERQLVSVATDGSEASVPVKLTAAPVNGLAAILSRDGTAVAWTAQAPDGRRAAFEAPIGGVPAGTDPRVSTWSKVALHVTDLRATAGALVGSRDDGAALRFPLGGKQPQEPVVLGKVGDVVNHSIPWPVLSLDGQRVTYQANTKTGWHAWTVPLAGGALKELPGAWSWDLVTPHGLIHSEPVHQEAVFVSDLAGHRTRLSPWYDSVLGDPHLLPGNHRVAWHASNPKAGWYVADPAAAQPPPAKPPAVLAMPDVPGEAGAPGVRPLATASHFVRIVAGQVQSFAVDGSGATQPIVLDQGVAPRLVVDPVSERAAFFRLAKGGKPAATVMSARVDGSDGKSPITVMALPAPVEDLVMLPASGRVLATARTGAGSSLYAAKIDGSEASKPLLLASGLPGWLIAALPSASGAHVLTVHAVLATAVPHPDLLLATAATTAPADPTKAAYRLAPDGFQLWDGPGWTGGMNGTTGGHLATGPGGQHALLRGPGGLYSARVDGSQVSAPPLLGTATERVGPALSPDGTRLALREGGALVVTRIAAAGSQHAVTKSPQYEAVSARWTADSKRLVWLAGPDTKQGKPGRLYVVDAGGTAAPEPLHPASFAADKLLALVPGAGLAIVESTGAGDHSLYAVATDGTKAGEAPVAITPIDDVGERFVGLLDSAP